MSERTNDRVSGNPHRRKLRVLMVATAIAGVTYGWFQYGTSALRERGDAAATLIEPSGARGAGSSGVRPFR
jgi:hypothetical protein